MKKMLWKILSPLLRIHRWSDGVYEVAIGRRFVSPIFDISFHPFHIERVR